MESTQSQFINEMCDSIKMDIIALTPKLPEEWDGVELRWLIADKFAECVFGNVGKRKGRRYLDYKNTMLVNNF